MTPLAVEARPAGSDTCSAGARRSSPLWRYTLSWVLNARSALPTVPVALTRMPLLELPVTLKPWVWSQRLVVFTPPEVGAKRARKADGDR